MATITDSEVLEHRRNRFLDLRIQIDGVDYFSTINSWHDTNTANQNAILATIAERQRVRVEFQGVDFAIEEYISGTSLWSDLPSGPEKQLIARHAVREAIRNAREAKRLLRLGRQNRGEALALMTRCRRIKSRVWDELDAEAANNAQKAAYLNLDGPGAGTEYAAFKGFMDDLHAIRTEFSAVVGFLDTYTVPHKIVDRMGRRGVSHA